MVLSKKLVSTGLTAALLASLLATAFAGSAFAATTATVPANAVGDVAAAPVSLGTVSFSLGSTDISTTGNLTATLPAGYTWATSGTIATPQTGTSFAVGDGAMVGGQTVTFAVTAIPSVTTAASLTFAGALVKGSFGAVAGNIVLTYSGTWTGGSLVVATVSTGFVNGPYGTAIQYRTNVTSRPADGSSFIDLQFQTLTSHTATTIAVTGVGTFIGGTGAFAGKTGASVPLTPGTIGAGDHLYLASNAVGTATVTVSYSDGSATVDSITPFTFTVKDKHGDDDHDGRDEDRGNGNGHGARKVGFFDNPTFSCATGATPISGAKTFGFAIFNTTGHKNKMLNVNVVLKGALPNVSYDVWVNQDLGGCPLATPTKVGAVHTNRHGNGTAHLRVALVSGATHFWVSATSGASVLRTRAASFKIKH